MYIDSDIIFAGLDCCLIVRLLKLIKSHGDVAILFLKMQISLQISWNSWKINF